MSPDEHLRRAAADLGTLCRVDEPLGPLTTYRVGGPAAIFVAPTSLDDLQAVSAVVARYQLPVLVVGRGSNLLVADAGFAGVAMSLADWADGIELSGVEVTAGSAVALPVLARRTAAAGLTGSNGRPGVPGSIGLRAHEAGGQRLRYRACPIASRSSTCMQSTRNGAPLRARAPIRDQRCRPPIVLTARLTMAIATSSSPNARSPRSCAASRDQPAAESRLGLRQSDPGRDLGRE